MTIKTILVSIFLVILTACGSSLIAPNNIASDKSEDINFHNITKKFEFKSGTAQLISPFHNEFELLAGKINEADEKHFTIEGHTDNVGSKESNQILSEQRANKIMSILISKGCHPSRLKAVGYGESHPISSNQTKQGRKNNRRIEIRSQF